MMAKSPKTELLDVLQNEEMKILTTTSSEGTNIVLQRWPIIQIECNLYWQLGVFFIYLFSNFAHFQS